MAPAWLSSKMRAARRKAALQSYPWLFLHIPKTGGTSVRTALGMGTIPHHVTALWLWQECPEAFSKFSFAFVRNPWDRMVSYFYYQRERDWEKPGRFDRVEMVQQVDFIFDEAGQPLVDFVGRYENLAEDFDTICGHIGIPTPPLQHLNRSEHRHYRECYDEEAMQFVIDHFADDIKRFGYSF
jgi:hypothetical protein